MIPHYRFIDTEKKMNEKSHKIIKKEKSIKF